MKFLAKSFILFVFLASPIFGQVNITGNLKDITTTNVSTNVQVDFELQNYGGQIPHVTSSGTIVQVKKTFKPNSSGIISGTVYQNSVITPAGTFYKVCILIQGTILRCNNYLINTSFDLNSAIPLDVTPVVGPSQLIVQCRPFDFLSGSLTWTMSHNFGDLNVWGNAFDASGNQIYPDKTVKTDLNTLTMTWVNPQAGRGLACHAGSINIATNQPNAVITNPMGAQAIAGSLSASSLISGNINNILFVDGSTYSTCQAAIDAAGSVTKAIIQIPSNYLGPECPTSTNVDGIQESITTPNITIWDFRGGNVGHNVDWNSNAQDGANHIHTRLSVMNYQTSLPSNFTESAILGTEIITGAIPTSQSVAGGTFEVDTTGAITTSGNELIQAINGQFAVRSTGGSLLQVMGIAGGGGIDRVYATTNIIQASGVYAFDPKNFSTSGATIAESYGLIAALPTSGTRNNNTIFSQGPMVFADNIGGIDVMNQSYSLPTGATAQKLLRFGGDNSLDTAGVNQYSTQYAGEPYKFIYVPGTKTNWLTGCQVNVDNGCEFTPSTVVGGTTFTTPVLKVLTSGISTPNQITSTLATGTAPFSVASTTVVPNLTVQNIASPVGGSGVQGTDTKLLSAGTISGTLSPLCTDANGGATTSGCPAAVVIRTAKSSSPCNTGTGSNSACQDTLTWSGGGFSSTPSAVVCQGKTTAQFTGQSTSNQAAGLVIDSYTTTTVTTTTETFRSIAAQFQEIHCIGVQ